MDKTTKFQSSRSEEVGCGFPPPVMLEGLVVFQSSRSEEVGCGSAPTPPRPTPTGFSPLEARKWAAGKPARQEWSQWGEFQSSRSEEVGCGCQRVSSTLTAKFQSSRSEEVGCGLNTVHNGYTMRFSPLEARKWAAGQPCDRSHAQVCCFSPLEARKWAAGLMGRCP